MLYRRAVCDVPSGDSLLFIFIFMGLVSQYHVPIPDSIDASSMRVEGDPARGQNRRSTIRERSISSFRSILRSSWPARTARPNRTERSPGAAGRLFSTTSASGLPTRTSTGTTPFGGPCMRVRITRTASRPLPSRRGNSPSPLRTRREPSGRQSRRRAAAGLCSSA